MQTLISGLSVQQVFVVFTNLSALAILFTAAKMVIVSRPRGKYASFLGILTVWLGICILTLRIPLETKLYFWAYVTLCPLSWIFYFIAARSLYGRIFGGYPGIAFAGRWSLITAAGLSLVIAICSVALSPNPMKQSAAFETVGLLDRAVLFGVTAFLILLVSLIVRYPITIQKNLVVHTLAFSSIMFFQALFQVADQWTAGNQYTMFWNSLTAVMDSAMLTAWAVFIVPAGEIDNVRIRRLTPELQAHLLGQLEAFNGILLKAARK